HVGAVVPLQLDHGETACLIDRQQIDTAAGVLPVAELLGDHEQVVSEDAYLVADDPLQVCPLVEPEVRERGGLVENQPGFGYLVQRHSSPAYSCEPVVRTTGC